MAFHFLNIDMMRKNITMMIRPKFKSAEVILSPHKKKHLLKLERIYKIRTKIIPGLEHLTYYIRFKKMELTILKDEQRGLNK